MGCNCGKGNQTNQVFVFTHPKTQQQTTYSTEIEARAAVIRNGGGNVQPVSR